MSPFNYVCKNRLFSAFSNTQLSSLYFSSKELVEVTSQPYSEDYKKIDLENIQALVTKPTQWFVIKLIIYSLLTILMLTGILIPDFNWKIFFGCLSIVLIIPLTLTILAGKTCEVHVFTAVGDYHLHSIATYKNFSKVIDTINELILPIQGVVDTTEIENNLEEYSKIQSRT